jgi:hypothetical protein
VDIIRQTVLVQWRAGYYLVQYRERFSWWPFWFLCKWRMVMKGNNELGWSLEDEPGWSLEEAKEIQELVNEHGAIQHPTNGYWMPITSAPRERVYDPSVD